MAVLSGEGLLNTIPWDVNRSVSCEGGRALGHQRLDDLLTSVDRLLFDDRSRFIFFSDCHRGDRGSTDDFAPNVDLFLHALTYYEQAGFTYVEVGDGDDLWKYPDFERVRLAYPEVFNRLHSLDRAGRLHLILGNHDMPNRLSGLTSKDGMRTREGLLLQHRRSRLGILVVHGHQVDLCNDSLSWISSWVVHHIWPHLQRIGFHTPRRAAAVIQRQNGMQRWLSSVVGGRRNRVERRMLDWTHAREHAVICGHTHRPVSAAAGTPPYFNTGSCTIPGLITGVEIFEGALRLVAWKQGEQQAQRKIVVPPIRLNQTTMCA